MEPEGDKEPSDNLEEFMRKRSENSGPIFATKLRNYAILKQKRLKAAAARQRNAAGAKNDKKACEDAERRGDSANGQIKQRRSDKGLRGRSGTRSHSHEPEDACCGRRRRRRRRSCGRRRRRRRRSCRRRRRRRSCRRRRRRSRSRRRRRRSCRRRRLRRRRCRR